jgi:putative exosortase-associated protein (TIGR04073 family)
LKIGRGLTNAVVSPLDIPWTVARWWNEADTVGGYCMAPTVGLGEGVCNGVVRLGAGVLEILSFPLIYQPEPLYERPLGESVFGGSDTESEPAG